MLQPKEGGRRERILYMGAWGTGKTTAWLNIAKWSHDTGSPSKFYALDTDVALEAFLEPGGEYADLVGPNGNIEWVPVYEWEEYVAAVNNFGPKLTRDDWLVIDFISPSWDAVQSWYIRELFKDDPVEYFLSMRRQEKSGSAFDGYKDWSQINRVYKTWMNQMLHRTLGHKFLTAEVKSLGQGETKENRATFGAFGVKPAGQKQLGHQPHTLLLGRVDRQGEINITTVKDRQREVLEEHPVNEFTIDYLCNVAGWTL